MSIDGSHFGSPTKSRPINDRYKGISDTSSVLKNLAEKLRAQQLSAIQKPLTNESSIMTSPPFPQNLTPSGYQVERSLNAVDYSMTPNAQFMQREQSGSYILPTEES